MKMSVMAIVPCGHCDCCSPAVIVSMSCMQLSETQMCPATRKWQPMKLLLAGTLYKQMLHHRYFPGLRLLLGVLNSDFCWYSYSWQASW